MVKVGKVVEIAFFWV